MKILLVNISDTKGGASIAAGRLSKGLRLVGISPITLVQDKTGDDNTVIGPKTNVEKVISKIRPRLDQFFLHSYKKRQGDAFSTAWVPSSGIIRKINEIDPDIVHLQWIAAGMVCIESIAKIKRPIVWALQDMWAFTGGCHYDNSCGKYEKECGACPILNSDVENDLSRRVFRRKKKTYNKVKSITVTGISKWIVNCAARSTLLSDRRIVHIPNIIDTSVYKPFDAQKARELWRLPQDKKLVLFGAIGGVNNPIKGFAKLSEALCKLKNKNIELVIFGSGEPGEPQDSGLITHHLGHLYDDVSLVTLYSAVDVMVVPSLQEAFGQTAAESMACGTPVVAFGATGLLDIVDHQVNGYLAQPFSTDDLARGIDWVLDNPDHKDLGRKAREKVLKEFGMLKVAGQYKKLYEEILRA